MRSKFIRPLRLRVVKKNEINTRPSTGYERWTIPSPMVGVAKEGDNMLYQNPMIKYPPFPKDYEGDSAAEACFEIMQFLYALHHDTYFEECKQAWHDIVSKHLATSSTPPRIYQHVIYKLAKKNPTWAHLVALRLIYGHRALTKSMRNNFQRKFPKSDLGLNRYNEKSSNSNLSQTRFKLIPEIQEGNAWFKFAMKQVKIIESLQKEVKILRGDLERAENFTREPEDPKMMSKSNVHGDSFKASKRYLGLYEFKIVGRDW